MKNPFPAFQWYPRDWLSSIARSSMTLEQQGAYRNLLDHAWISDPPCSLPDDDLVLAGLSGLGEKWGEIGPVIRRWFVARNGRVFNTKQVETFRAMVRLRASKSEGGKRGNAKRWNDKGKESSHTDRIPIAEGSQEHRKSSPSSSSSSSSSFAVNNRYVTSPPKTKSNGNGGHSTDEALVRASRLELVKDIVSLTGDSQEQSVRFFTKFVHRVDQNIVRRVMSETRQRAADGDLLSAAKYFTHLANKELKALPSGASA